MAQITGTRYDGVECTLVLSQNNEAVNKDHHCVTHGNRTDLYVIRGGRPPHKASSTGYVYVTPDEGGTEVSFYPSVFGFMWVPTAEVKPHVAGQN